MFLKLLIFLLLYWMSDQVFIISSTGKSWIGTWACTYNNTKYKTTKVSTASFICFLFFSKWAMLIKQKWCFIQLTTEKLHSPGMCLLRSQIRWVICSKFDFSLREECRPKKISPLNINMHEYAVNGLNCVQRVTIAALHVRFALQIFTPGGPFLTQSPWDLCLLLETKQGSSTC